MFSASSKMQCLKYALLILSLISSMVIVPLNSDANVTNANATNANITNANATNANVTKKNGSSVEPRCLRSLHSLYEELASTVPPLEHSFWGNYHNISRALFPTVNLPSLYVKVTIQFQKDFGNGTKKINDKLPFKILTWSEASCFVFVSAKFTIFDALNFYFLATILPRRRSRNLIITVPPFCSDSRQNDNELWTYAVSKLQDIAINANVSDPSLNTARCVVIGQENSEQEIILEPPYYVLPWLVLVFSLLATIVLFCAMYSIIGKEWNKKTAEANKETSKANEETSKNPIYSIEEVETSVPEKSALIYCITDDNLTILNKRTLIGTILTFVLFNIILGVFGIVVSLYFVIAEMVHNKHGTYSIRSIYSIVYSIVYFSLLFVCGLVYFCKKCCKKCCKTICNCESNAHTNNLGHNFLFPCIFQVFHYLLWVVCRIISEPRSAISIFLLESLATFFLVFAIYLYRRDIENKADKTKLMIFHLVCTVCVCWFMLIIVGFVSIYGGIPETSLASIVETGLTITLMWLVKNSGLRLL